MFLIRWIFRVVLRRFGWVALVAAVRSLARRGGQRRIDEATAAVTDKMPDRVATALQDLPGDPLRVAGTAMAAGRSARKAADVSRTAAGTAGQSWRMVDKFRRSVTDFSRSVTGDIRGERDDLERQLWSDYHRSRGDHARADRALLDARAGRDGFDDDDDVVWDQVPPAPGRGRLRHRRARSRRPNRVRRSYQPPEKPWEI